MADTIESLRGEIDECDRELVAAFTRRMDISRRIARFKRERGLPTFDAAREAVLFAKIEAMGGEYSRRLYETIVALSRELQESERK